ncbi:hypothetical protein HF521_003890 [Silurus meridionalis]|uniref:Uncharacterized protein n=1 Tax=Silurus meridionalis TaxID=175797 RepID=A0A8T0B1M8_SILME|nr:hypothetical protein HF521_003890 [Silurus meridionalis]
MPYFIGIVDRIGKDPGPAVGPGPFTVTQGHLGFPKQQPLKVMVNKKIKIEEQNFENSLLQGASPRKTHVVLDDDVVKALKVALEEINLAMLTVYVDSC